MRIKSSFVLLLASLLTACAGGNEVPNMSNSNIIRGTVTSNSASLANSEVIIYPLDVNATGALIGQSYTTTTNEKGEFEVEVEQSGLYSVIAQNNANGEKAISSEIEIDGDKTPEIILETKPTIALTGKVSRNLIPDINVFYVFIPGTRYFADSINGNGFYTFNDIPQGKYPIAFTYGNKGTVIKVATTKKQLDSLFLKDLPFADEIESLQSKFEEYSNNLTNLYYINNIDYGKSYVPQWYKEVDFRGVEIYDQNTGTFVEQTNVNENTNPPSTTSITLDDFENSYGDSPNQNALAAMYASKHYPDKMYMAGGYWYTYSDIDKDEGNSVIIPKIYGSDISPLISNNCESLNNNSLSLQFILKDKIKYPFAGIGFLIFGEESDYHDLSSMEKLSFWAKGEGVIRLKFFSSHDDSAINDKGHFGKDITLSSEWKLYEIKAEDITPQAESETETLGLKWKDISKKVNKIHFETQANYPVDTPISLHLDDIVIHGVSIDDLIK